MKVYSAKHHYDDDGVYRTDRTWFKTIREAETRIRLWKKYPTTTDTEGPIIHEIPSTKDGFVDWLNTNGITGRWLQ